MKRNRFSEKLFTRDRNSVQTCPFLQFLTTAYNTNCVECGEDTCTRMHAVGLDIHGNPLSVGKRPACGAKTRNGGACAIPVVPGKSRCRAHGGLSTGPKTEAGRERIRAAQQRRWKDARSEKAAVDQVKSEASPVQNAVAREVNEPRTEPRRKWRRTKRIPPMAL